MSRSNGACRVDVDSLLEIDDCSFAKQLPSLVLVLVCCREGDRARELMCDLSALIRRDKSGKHPLFFLLLPLLLAKHAAAASSFGVT